MKKVLTLCIPVRGNKFLLGTKNQGPQSGLWNGFGGTINIGESLEQATRQSLAEETKITDGLLTKLGILDFYYRDDPDTTLEVHVFKLTNFLARPRRTKELHLQWFPANKIPFSAMWAEDTYWLPLFIEGKLFRGQFIFDTSGDKAYSTQPISYRLETVEVLK